MNKPTAYYFIGSLLTALLLGYIFYNFIFLLGKISVVSEKNLPTIPEIATFNLEKFKELKLK